MEELIKLLNKRLYRWENALGCETTRKKALAKAEECSQILKIVRRMQMLDKEEFVEINTKKCSEANNCFGVKEEDGKKYCRGCGNLQPKANESSSLN